MMPMGQGLPVGEEPELMMDINTTPLIDVLLVLLVMLIITIPIQLHAVNVEMPVGPPPPVVVEPVVAVIGISANDRLSRNGEPVTISAWTEHGALVPVFSRLRGSRTIDLRR